MDRDGLIMPLPIFLQKEQAGRISSGKLPVDGGVWKTKSTHLLFPSCCEERCDLKFLYSLKYRCLCAAPFNAVEDESDLSDMRVVRLSQRYSWDLRSTGAWSCFTWKLVCNVPKNSGEWILNVRAPVTYRCSTTCWNNGDLSWFKHSFRTFNIANWPSVFRSRWLGKWSLFKIPAINDIRLFKIAIIYKIFRLLQ